MEGIYFKGSNSHLTTEKIHLNNYFITHKMLTKKYFKKSNSIAGDLESLMGVSFSRSELSSLMCQCSPNHLSVEGEVAPIDTEKDYKMPYQYEKTTLPQDQEVDLETLKMLKKRTKADEEALYTKLRYRNQVSLKDETVTSKKLMKPGSEFVVSIRVHFPFKYEAKASNRNMAPCQQEILLLGSQTLEALCKVIICMDEFGDADGDVSENPDAPIEVRNKDLYQSSMFYIGNTFYIDQRDPNTHKDYSEVVRRWAAKRKLNMNQVENMSNVKIGDLIVRFGYPYVYQHLGNCEHLLIFSDARLLYADDVLIREQYPLYKSLAYKQARYCIICASNVSKWIVVGSDRHTQDPAYLCDTCFRLYHYEGKKKIGDFKAYHYYDRRALL